jgi:hypothetical protein
MKKIKIITIILFVFFQYNLVFSQKTTSGRLVDSETKQSISFANISIKNTNLGTLSNFEGNFVLPITNFPATILFSHISYEAQEMTIDGNEQNLEVKLKPAIIILNPVTITDGYAQELITKTYHKAMENQKKYCFGEFFYRQITKTNSEPFEIQEIIYEGKCNNSTIIGTLATQGRYAVKKSQPVEFKNFSTFTKRFGAFPNDTSKHIGNILSPIAQEYYNLRVTKIIQGENQEIAEVEFANKKGIVSGKLYIDTKNYLLLKYISRIENHESFKPKLDNSKYNALNYNIIFEVSFKPYQTNIILESIKVNYTFDLYKKEKLEYKMDITSYAFFYNTTEHDKGIEYLSPKIIEKDQKTIKKLPYNKEFWQNNPIIKRTPLEEDIIKFFEEAKAFGTMFSDN